MLFDSLLNALGRLKLPWLNYGILYFCYFISSIDYEVSAAFSTLMPFCYEGLEH